MVEETQWHRITFFDRLAEIAGEYVKKGRPIYVEGRLKYGKFTNKDGVEQNTCDIIATEMQLLGAREGMGAPDPPAVSVKMPSVSASNFIAWMISSSLTDSILPLVLRAMSIA